MTSSEYSAKLKKICSVIIVTNLFLTLFVTIGLWNSPNVRADSLSHTVGNLDIIGMTDYGRIGTRSILWNNIEQTAAVSTDRPYHGLVLDHSLYDHSGGDYGIADWWDSYQNPIYPDFRSLDADQSIIFEENSPSLQKSICSFTQVDANGEIGVGYDVRVHQTVWTLENKNWAIVEWEIENLMGSDLTQVHVGMEVFSSASGGSNWFGVAGDEADDLDYWDDTNKVYYLQDNFLTTIGYCSADISNPLDHYYGDETNFFNEDKSAYTALTSADTLAQNDPQFNYGTDPIYSLVSWNNKVIPAYQTLVFPMVIACGYDSSFMLNAINEARDFWDSTRLKITEIQDSPDIDEKIEIYNSGSRDINLAGYYLSPDGGTTKWYLDSLGTIPSGGYAVYTPFGGDDLDDEGDILTLFTDGNFYLDRIGYGTMGTTPDPLLGESTARHWEGTKYSRIWNRETTPTFGSQNTVLGSETDPKVVLNEVLFNPGTYEAFIELKYIGLGVDVNLNGWQVVIDVPYTIGDITLNPTYQYYIINEPIAPGLFGTITPSGDNVYLYDDTGVLMDMVGWSSAHQPDTSVMRVPEGEGTYDGYDDPSSISAGWQFDQYPTMALVNIDPDQEKAGDLGSMIIFNLTITNVGPTADVVDVNYSSLVDGLPGWWEIELFYGGGGWIPLADTDGDGLLDVGSLDPFSSIIIVVRVTVPSELPIGGVCVITLDVTSSINPWAFDTAVLQAGAYPHIEAYKSVNYEYMYLYGGRLVGFVPDEATLTITLEGKGGVPGALISQDVIFCMDSSSSMLSSDPSRERIAGAKYYVDLLSYPARAGVVDFDDTSRLVIGLTDDYDAVKAALNSINDDGMTDMSRGLILSINELINNGNYNYNRIIILLTDGSNNYPIQDDATLAEAQRAADNGIIIYTIGLGDNADEALLQQVASITGGKYYWSPTPDNLQDIFGIIAEETISIAGEDPDPDDLIPLLTDVLPPYIDYIPGSFINPYTGEPMEPSRITIDGFGNTILEWNITKIAIGAKWGVSFNITASEIGLKETNLYGVSAINYDRYTDVNTTVPTIDFLPRVWINVLPIPPTPPILYNNLTEDKEDVWLNWTEPLTSTHHYLIYRAEDKQGFDFSTPWKNTSNDINPISGIKDPLNRNWLDDNAALPTSAPQYYYCVRSVEASGNISTTSNTVGKWTKAFSEGVGTFSLPLEPFEIKEVDWYCDDIPNVEYIKWVDPATQTWITHYKSDALGINDTQVVVGEGYEIKVDTQTYYTFTGRPGCSIRYDEGCLPAPTGFSLSLGPMANTMRSSNFGSRSTWSMCVALGDVDSDGNLDAVVGNFFEQNVVYLGDGNGKFSAFSYFGEAFEATASIALGDVDSDNDLDIVTGNQYMGYGGQNVVFLGDGDGTFDTTSYNFGTGSDSTGSIALGYIDSDSNLDIVCGNQFNGVDCQNVVYLGDGDGTFDTTSYNFGSGFDFTTCVALGYVDSDAILDIVVGNYAEQNVVYIGDGDGSFDTTSYNFGIGDDPTSSIALGYVNSDSYLDIAVGNRYDGVNGQNVVYLGDGDGTFDTTSHNFGNGTDITSSVALGDMNQDDILDIFVGNEYDWIDDGQNFVYFGNGDGTVDTYFEFGTGIDNTMDLAVDDINNDDRLDIVCADSNDANAVYYTTISYTVNLSWDPVSSPAFDRYVIYRAGTRDGLNIISLPVLATTTSTRFSDLVDLCDGTEFYYMVAALKSSEIVGYNSTYSIGIWFCEFSKGYESLGLPLEPLVVKNVDSYCDDIPNMVGMNYYLYSESRWGWHSTRMPKGAYDPFVVMSEGYQLSTEDDARFAFIGI
ncbi:MAG: VCBS repeat-containing protein [Thermoplasmata archaeon]|nr:MAG: VCBS repeat-containing protein [Thermoplasmata archaeon]